VGKEELHFATCFSVKQTTENGKEVLRLAFYGVLRRNKHAHDDGCDEKHGEQKKFPIDKLKSGYEKYF